MPNSTTPIRPRILHRLFVRQKVKSIELHQDEAHIRLASDVVKVNLASAKLASSKSGIFNSLLLETDHGSFSISGLPSSAVTDVEAAIGEAVRRATIVEQLTADAGRAEQLMEAWAALTARDFYLNASDAELWDENAAELTTLSSRDADLIDRLSDREQRMRRRIDSTRAELRKHVDKRNGEYATHLLNDHQAFFDTVESNPLTQHQRDAIVHDEDNALVIAGAGTGKTSTVVGKVGFILLKGWAKPEEILLLSYSKDTVREMRERISRKLNIDIEVRTFHKLGLDIVSQVNGKRPSICREAEDDKARDQTLKQIIDGLVGDEAFRKDFLTFQTSLRRGYKPGWEFKSRADYAKYLLDIELRTLSGHLVKSYEECEIANWLFLNGVNFQYERLYEVDLSTPDHRPYKPDFYLSDYGIYLEHWGISKDGRTAPSVNNEEYHKRMAWARESHAKHSTKLIETFSWQRQDGTLLTNLEELLNDKEVELRPIPADQVLNVLNEVGRVSPFVDLLGKFINRFKSGGYHLADLKVRAKRSDNPPRTLLFISLLEMIFKSYEVEIHKNGEIDFDDMITMADEHVRSDAYRSPFRYIIVDEFQDIAKGRAKLIQALRDQVRGARIFAVGDDWQSIYRFAGSDISLTTNFAHHFGYTKKTALEHTFRFHDRLAAFSSKFVQANTSQLRKQITTSSTSAAPGVVMWMQNGNQDPFDVIIEEIAREHPGASVFIVARFKHELPNDLNFLQRKHSKVSLRALTAHGSKGLEADYVIISGVKRGKHGFPSEIADDPVMEVVLPDGEEFAYAEERRLFYVAMTRARKRVFVVANIEKLSVFAAEILADPSYEKEVRGATSGVEVICPECTQGRIVERQGTKFPFFGCTNYPLCCFAAASCPRCKHSRMVNNGSESKCVKCEFKARVCPSCHDGILYVGHNNQTGAAFWGCTNFYSPQIRCRYKESARVNL